MLTFREVMHYLYISCRDCCNFPYYDVKIYRNGYVEDVTSKIIKRKHCKCIYSSFRKIPYMYQIHCKNTNKYYIYELTLDDLINNNVTFPESISYKPRRTIISEYEIYVNGKPLEFAEKIKFKNHYVRNSLFYAFLFHDITLKSIVIKKGSEIIETITDNFSLYTIETIAAYL